MGFSLLGDKKSPTVTSTNEVQYSPEQQQLFNMALPNIQQFAQQGISVPQNTVAGFNQNDLAAQQGALNQVGNINQLGQQGANSLSYLMNPNILSPDSNPALQQYSKLLGDQHMDDFLQRVMPALRGGFSMQGGPYGGGMSKEGIASGLAGGQAMEGLDLARAGMFNQAYGQGLGAMQGANALLPSMQGAQLAGTQVQGAVGEQQRGMEQTQLDAANQQQLMQQIMPLLMAQQLYGFGLGMPGAKGVSTATGAVPGKTGALQGAAGGAMAGSAFGVPGAVIGGGLGALLGGFG
jgi:hypothetical protein